jgi:Zn-dependent protease with chaperone function
MAPPEGGFRKELAMGLSRLRSIVLPLALLPVVLSHTRYAAVENFGDEQITTEQVDALLEEVAAILDVALLPSTPKVRIMVMSPGRIADLYRQVVTVAPHGADARALYLPGANVVAISHYSRTVLGHELAHYLTDHYLKSTPRRNWERIALMVEDELPSTPRIVARRVPGADFVAIRPLLAPLAPAN